MSAGSLRLDPCILISIQHQVIEIDWRRVELELSFTTYILCVMTSRRLVYIHQLRGLIKTSCQRLVKKAG